MGSDWLLFWKNARINALEASNRRLRVEVQLLKQDLRIMREDRDEAYRALCTRINVDEIINRPLMPRRSK
jgi:hypothetical protein